MESEGRAISRRVLGEMSAAFRTPWQQALEFQQRNPDMLAYALRCSDEFGPAAKAMVPFLAMFHPSILRVAVVHCEAVAAEFAYDDAVVGGAHYVDVRDGDEIMGGQQLHNRLAKLEARQAAIDELADEVRHLAGEVAEALAAHREAR